MKKHLLITALVMSFLGIAYCAYQQDFAFCLSFTLAAVGIVIKIMDEDKKLSNDADQDGQA